MKPILGESSRTIQMASGLLLGLLFVLFVINSKPVAAVEFQSIQLGGKFELTGFVGSGLKEQGPVAISADGLVAVSGSPYDENSRGAIRVYSSTEHGTLWTERGRWVSPSSTEGLFGHSVAISGNGSTIVVGAPRNSDGWRDQGAFYVYSWDNQNGILSSPLATFFGPFTSAQQGYYVAISGDGRRICSNVLNSSSNVNRHMSCFKKEGDVVMGINPVPHYTSRSFFASWTGLSYDASVLVFALSGTIPSEKFAILRFIGDAYVKQPITSLPAGIPNDVSISPDGMTIGLTVETRVVIYQYNPATQLYDLLQFFEASSLAQYGSCCSNIARTAFSADGKRMLLTVVMNDQGRGGAIVMARESTSDQFDIASAHLIQPAGLDINNYMGQYVGMSAAGDRVIIASMGRDSKSGLFFFDISETTDSPTTSSKTPTKSPSSSPLTSPPTPPICKPAMRMKRAGCRTRVKQCGKWGVKMKWTGMGCRKKGKRLSDGGCQCQGYCGYNCKQACIKDPRRECRWDAKLNICVVKATGLPGEAMESCPIA